MNYNVLFENNKDGSISLIEQIDNVKLELNVHALEVTKEFAIAFTNADGDLNQINISLDAALKLAQYLSANTSLMSDNSSKLLQRLNLR